MYDIKMYTIYTIQSREYIMYFYVRGANYTIHSRGWLNWSKMYFLRGGKVANNFWMWYQMIQRQYLDFEGGVKQSPLESYKISIIRYGWEGYGWEWIIRGGVDLFSWSEINCQSYVSWIMNLTWSFRFITKIQIILRK